MSIEMQQTIPILRIFDVAKAREFYVDFLGFAVDWEHRFEPGFPLYMQVSRAGLTLHLSEHHGDACPGSTVFIWMQSIDEFHREITGRNYGYLHPGVERTFYDARCMEVIDPFGNRIRFNERIATESKSKSTS
jgi:catechol 2,3-dioxygenase-like lactoylglutathione lyase family enzyme